MPQIIHVDANTATREGILTIVDRDGAVVLENALSIAQVAAILTELEPYFAGTEPFDDELVGGLCCACAGNCC